MESEERNTKLFVFLILFVNYYNLFFEKKQQNLDSVSTKRSYILSNSHAFAK
jgi:hypothetical protein